MQTVAGLECGGRLPGDSTLPSTDLAHPFMTMRCAMTVSNCSCFRVFSLNFDIKSVQISMIYLDVNIS